MRAGASAWGLGGVRGAIGFQRVSECFIFVCGIVVFYCSMPLQRWFVPVASRYLLVYRCIIQIVAVVSQCTVCRDTNEAISDRSILISDDYVL